MAECIILKGGGGADLDVVTAGAGDVVSPKVTVDKAGNPVTGTMVERGAYTSALSCVSDGNSLYARIPTGAYRTLTPASGAPEITVPVKDIGIESWKIRADTSIGGVQGGIPLQGAEVGGDRAWATNMSNWAGTINLGVRNGHFLNGVNWIQRDIPNYQPWNIKKGVDIGGVVGTWEGYVPTPTDLYLRGNNIVGWVKGGSGGSSYIITFDTGQISFGMMAADGYLTTNSPINLTGYNGVAVEGYLPGNATTITIQLATANGAYTQTNGGIAKSSTAVGDYSNFTAYCNVSTINAARYIHINAINSSFYIYRIWLY